MVTSTMGFSQTDLVRWNNTNYTPTLIANNITASNISISGGVSLSHQAWGDDTNFFQFGGLPTPQQNSGGIDVSRYIEFTISSTPGHQINLNQFNFFYRAQGTPQNFQVRYSKDNFTTYYTSTPDISVSGSWTNSSNNLSSVSPVLPGETVRIRVYAYNTWNNFHIKRVFNASTPNNHTQTPTITGTVSSSISTDLAITKTVSNINPVACTDSVTFTLTASNLGNNPSTVTVNDLLPSGYQYLSSNASQGTYNPANGIWSVGNLNTNDNAVLTITANVLSSGNYTNTATISGNTSDPVMSNNTATVNVTPNLSNIVNLAVTKTVNNTNPAVDSNVTFTINVQNLSSNNATGVVVTDLLPTGYDFISSTQGTYNSLTRTLTRNIANLAGSSSSSFTITARVRAGGNHNNRVSVTSNQCDTNPANNSASVSVTPNLSNTFDLAVTQTVSNQAPIIGNNVTFTITARNNGPQTATSALVNTLLGSGLQYINSSTATGSYNSATGVWSIGNMSNSASATLTITAQVLQGEESVYLSIAEITGNNIIRDQNMNNNKSYSILSPIGQEFLECNVNAENAVFQEDFGTGASRFGGELLPNRSNMRYIEPTQPAAWPNSLSDGQYSIVKNAQDANTSWKNLTDPSNPNGYFMVINADYAPNEFFRIRIMMTEQFCDNTRYNISFNVANVNSQADYTHCTNNEGGLILPEIGYFVENNQGQILGAGTSGTIPYSYISEWLEQEFIFISGADDEWVEFILFNKAPGGCGNDLAIDNITVHACMPLPIELDIVIEGGGNSEVCGGEDVIMEVKYSDTNGYVWPPSEWGTDPEHVDYQWQYSADGSSWVDILAETNDKLIIEDFSPENEGYYRLQYAQAGNINKELCRYVSGQFFHVHNTTPNLSPIELDGITEENLCLGNGPVQLISNYTFSDEYDNWNESYHYFEWQSSNPAVATINQNGLLTLISSGTVIITFTVHSANGHCTSSITRTIRVRDTNCNAPTKLATNPMTRQKIK